ncbi:MAG: hypothetical protein ABFC80_08735 [Coriobacteriales bacterium]
MHKRVILVSVVGSAVATALLALAVVPACAMPSCSGAAYGSAGYCDQPVSSRFVSVCGAGTRTATGPCDSSGDSCDTTMSHGRLEAAVARGAEHMDLVPAVVAPGGSTVHIVTAEPVAHEVASSHPPDPLGVRLLI